MPTDASATAPDAGLVARRPRVVLSTEYGEKADVAVEVLRMHAPAGSGFGMHRHPEDQLVLVEQGACNLRVGDASWSVPAGSACWIPGDADHDLIATTDSQLVCVWLWQPDRAVGFAAAALRRPGILAAPPVLAGLTRMLARPDLREEVGDRAADVLFDVVVAAGREAPALQVPRHEAARDIARELLADPADRRSLADWARSAYCAERTIQRAFRAETGLGFHAWRTIARLDSARCLVADGMPVLEVSERVGFASVSGFISAYRRHFGVTPGHHAVMASQAG